jgi:hypothetical protein
MHVPCAIQWDWRPEGRTGRQHCAGGRGGNAGSRDRGAGTRGGAGGERCRDAGAGGSPAGRNRPNRQAVRGLRLELLAQDHDVGHGIPIYPGARSTSLLRARLGAENWSLGAGDASTRAGYLPRFHAAGRGLDADWGSGAVDARVAVFYPRVGWGIDPAGPVVSSGAGLRTPAGRVGLAVLHATRTAAIGGATGLGRSAALQYGIHRGAHRLDLEGGWIASKTATAGGREAPASTRRISTTDAMPH